MEMHFSRLLLIVAVALPLSACLTAADQQQAREIAASDDVACRSAGLKPGTPAYAKCREDRSKLRVAQAAEVQAMQRETWTQQQLNTLPRM
jgi:hypothetical protein